MQIIRIPPGNMRQILKITNISALKDIGHQVAIDDLSDVWNNAFYRFGFTRWEIVTL